MRACLLVMLLLLACNTKEERFQYESSIASKVYKSQLQYLDNTISNYSRISDSGYFLYKENLFLDSLADGFKKALTSNSVIPDKEKSKFFDRFAAAFSSTGKIDTKDYHELKTLPIRSMSDVDLLRIYVKSSFVERLLNNKLLPYDSWSTMASPKQTVITAGDEFSVDLANTAWAADHPNIWFLVKKNKDSLTKDNIIDTLYQDRDGVVHFKTKNYHKGENTLIFISRLHTPVMNDGISKQVSFFVK